MDDEKMRELCTKISSEKDSERLMQLVEELMKLLAAEQNAVQKNESTVKASRNTAA
ncbi:MAG: hypothetical protein JOZ80_18210 [Acidobacteriaceae bacterium]|nr:hypothetical protein [Acidobacteriaceae bacterium]